jgi:hypothetical protein
MLRGPVEVRMFRADAVGEGRGRPAEGLELICRDAEPVRGARRGELPGPDPVADRLLGNSAGLRGGACGEVHGHAGDYVGLVVKGSSEAGGAADRSGVTSVRHPCFVEALGRRCDQPGGALVREAEEGRVDEHDGRFTGEHRVRMIRWIVRELAETTDRIAGSAEAARGADGGWTEFDVRWHELRRTIDPWLADAERRIREKENRTT